MGRLRAENDKYRSKSEKYKKQLETANEKLEENQNRICDQVEKFQALIEKTTNERENMTQQSSEANQMRSELQIHVQQQDQAYKELTAKYKEMKRSASDAMNLVKKQETNGNTELDELNENDKLAQQVEDLNLQLLQQH